MSRNEKPPKTTKNHVGSAHYLPPRTSWEQYKKLRKFWYKKLQEEGHPDIEHFLEDGEGQASIMFKKAAKGSHAGSSASLGDAFSPETAEYYRLAGIFLEHADFSSIFGPKAKLYKYIWSLHSSGEPYRAVARHTHTEEYKKLKLSRGNHSVFWSHWNTKFIIKAMYLWHRTHEDGEIKPDEDE